MAKPKKTKSKADLKPGQKHITENRYARHKYEIVDSLECGLVLTGSEVKSLRDGKCSLAEAYGRVRDGEAWLLGCDIAEYPQATHWNHTPTRPRKLLMSNAELRKFADKAREKGLTLVPLKMFFNERGLAKVIMGLGEGKKLHDKRETLKKKDAKRSMDRALKNRG
jgi:SsrA-binding protein